MKQISKLLRDFLWGGGKGNQHRMHLVNWETVKRPLLDGGLQFKDPKLSNIAMGGNFLWQLFSNKQHPVSQLLWKKYLHGGSLRNIQIIWNSCRKVLEFFVQHLYRIPGNGRQTFLWDDKIKGNAPLNTNVSLTEIKLQLVNKGILRLSDIVSWDRKVIWDAWDFPKFLEHGQSILLAQT